MVRSKNRIIKKKHEELILSNNTKTNILKIIGHDLKNPLLNFRKLNSKFDYLIKRNDNNRIQELVNNLEFSSHNLITQIEGLLTWAMVNDTKLKPNTEPISLLDVKDELYTQYDLISRDKKIRFKVDNKGEDIINTDRQILLTILRNLIDNSFKHGYLTSLITVVLNNQAQGLVIIVHDDGSGLPESLLNQLNDPSLSHYKQNKYQHLGLGIVIELVRELNGKLSAKK